MPTDGPRHHVIAPDDHGGPYAIISWFLFVVVILAVATRIWIRLASKHLPGLDDAVIVIAGLFFAGLTVVAVVAVRHGIGERDNRLDASEMTRIQKDIYVLFILFYIVLITAKASVVVLLYRLAVNERHLRIIQVLAAFVLAWGLTSVFGSAFQCPLPRPWLTNVMTSDKCIDEVAFAYSMAAMDIATDVAIVLIPALVVWNLQMPADTKRLVFIVFFFRIFAISACIARIAFIRKLSTRKDFFFNDIPYLICTQLEAALAIFVSCTPALKPVSDLLSSGMLDVSLRPRQGGYTYNIDVGPTVEVSQDSPNNGGSIVEESSNKGNSNLSEGFRSSYEDRSTLMVLRPDRVESRSLVIAGERDGDALRGPNFPEHLIQQTTNWNVRVEPLSDENGVPGRNGT